MDGFTHDQHMQLPDFYRRLLSVFPKELEFVFWESKSLCQMLLGDVGIPIVRVRDDDVAETIGKF
jgi:hypothetical protein